VRKQPKRKAKKNSLTKEKSQDNCELNVDDKQLEKDQPSCFKSTVESAVDKIEKDKVATKTIPKKISSKPRKKKEPTSTNKERKKQKRNLKLMMEMKNSKLSQRMLLKNLLIILYIALKIIQVSLQCLQIKAKRTKNKKR
jgi:hypothetical protein